MQTILSLQALEKINQKKINLPIKNKPIEGNKEVRDQMIKKKKPTSSYCCHLSSSL